MNDAGIEIVRAGAEHLRLVAPLFDGYRVFYGRPSDPAGALAFVSERVAAGDSVIFLAVRDSEALGFTQLYPSYSSVTMKRLWILNDLFVRRAARRQGVAAALLERAARFAKETGARGLVLETAVDNLPAQRLYERLGWKRETAYHRYVLDV